jgi:hypothetical protein
MPTWAAATYQQASYPAQAPHFAAVPGRGDAVRPVPGSVSDAQVQQATTAAPTVTPTLVSSASRVSGLAIYNVGGTDTMYVLDAVAAKVYKYTYGAGTWSAAGTLPSTGTLTGTLDGLGRFAMDDLGNFYYSEVTSSQRRVHKYDSTGTEVVGGNWPLVPPGGVAGLGSFGTGSGFRLIATTNAGTSQVYDSTGALLQSGAAWAGSYLTRDHTSETICGVTSTTVSTVQSSGARNGYFGQSVAFGAVVAAAYGGTTDDHIYFPFGAVGLLILTRSGQLVGLCTALGTSIPQAAQSIIYNGTYYYNFSGNNLYSVPLSQLQAFIGRPMGAGLGLGFGAQLSTTAADANWYPAGTGSSAGLVLTMHPAWSTIASQVTGTYTIRSRQQVLANQAGYQGTWTIPSGQSSQFTVSLAVPAAYQAPGFYEVECKLFNVADGSCFGADLLYYGIGASGMPLSLASLPANSGTTALQRQVRLAGMLGLGLLRLPFDFRNTLPGGSATPLQHGAQNFSFYDASYQNAATEAASWGVRLCILIAGFDTATDLALMNSADALANWQYRVQELVAHYSAAPYNILWYEPYNEPSSGAFSNYVSLCQQTTYAGVKAANAAASVLGPAIINIDTASWTAYAAAGLFSNLDIVSVHPYAVGAGQMGWEESGWPGMLAQIQSLAQQYAGRALPLVTTEVGWPWQSPTEVWSQADYWARYWHLMRDAGCTQHNPYVLEGFLNTGHSDAFVHSAGGTGSNSYWTLSPNVFYRGVSNYPRQVTPAAMAQMAAVQLVAGRTYVGRVAHGVPHVFAVQYGPLAGDGGLLVLWADDLEVSVGVGFGGYGGGSVPSYDVLGVQTTLALPAGSATLGLGPAPVYVQIPQRSGSGTPAAVQLSAQPALGAGNVALAAAGGVASATSAAASHAASLLNDGIVVCGPSGSSSPSVSGQCWQEATSDGRPAATVTFAGPQLCNAVCVLGQAPGTAVAPRHLDVYGQNLAGQWLLLGAARDLYRERGALLTFDAQPLQAVRVECTGNVFDYGTGGGPSCWFSARTQARQGVQQGSYGPQSLYEIEAYGQSYQMPVPTWSGAQAKPAGYAAFQRLMVLGGSASSPGSTTTPVTFAATAAQQDTVVGVHLVGVQAASVWDNLHDTSAFSDLTVWWWNGTTWVQIDRAMDNSYGAQSRTNLAFQFKLQATVGAQPAYDANYGLAFGNASPVVMANWKNIWPLADDFLGSSLDSTLWTQVQAGSGITAQSLAVANSLLSLSVTGNALTNFFDLLQSTSSVPVGYTVGALLAWPNQTAGLAGTSAYDGHWRPELGYRTTWTAGSVAPAALRTGPATATNGAPYGWYLTASADTFISANTLGLTPVSLSRDASGNVAASVAGVSTPAQSTSLTGAAPLSFGVNRLSAGGSPDTLAVVADWIKVYATPPASPPSVVMKSV